MCGKQMNLSNLFWSVNLSDLCFPIRAVSLSFLKIHFGLTATTTFYLIKNVHFVPFLKK